MHLQFYSLGGDRVPISFKEFVRSRRVTDTPVGDFVTDAKRDSGFPDARSRQEMLDYLDMMGAPDAAVSAAKVLWRRYEKQAVAAV
jgi:hypothetical protein